MIEITILAKKVTSFCTLRNNGKLKTTKKRSAIRNTPTSSVNLKSCDDTSSLTRTHKRRITSSGHDTENAALRIAYTEINESADPEKYAIPKVSNEKTFCSVLDAVFCDTTHSRSAIATATIVRYSAPIHTVSTCPASGKIRRSKINPPTNKRVVI
jgi:hypothetical protein